MNVSDWNPDVPGEFGKPNMKSPLECYHVGVMCANGLQVSVEVGTMDGRVEYEIASLSNGQRLDLPLLELVFGMLGMPWTAPPGSAFRSTSLVAVPGLAWVPTYAEYLFHFMRVNATDDQRSSDVSRRMLEPAYVGERSALALCGGVDLCDAQADPVQQLQLQIQRQQQHVHLQKQMQLQKQEQNQKQKPAGSDGSDALELLGATVRSTCHGPPALGIVVRVIPGGDEGEPSCTVLWLPSRTAQHGVRPAELVVSRPASSNVLEVVGKQQKQLNARFVRRMEL